MMAIKFKLKVMLAIHEMTQKQLAEITGIDKICEALDCQPNDWIEHIKQEH